MAHNTTGRLKFKEPLERPDRSNRENTHLEYLPRTTYSAANSSEKYGRESLENSASHSPWTQSTSSSKGKAPAREQFRDVNHELTDQSPAHRPRDMGRNQVDPSKFDPREYEEMDTSRPLRER